MKTERVFCCIILSLVCAGFVTAQETSFRVMSYNIRFANPHDGIHYWDNRRPLVVSLIRYHGADLIGVQEALRRQLDEMTADMPEYDWFGVCRTDGTVSPVPDGEFSAILYRRDRFERLDGNTFWLSPTPDIAGSKGWDAVLPRIVTWALFTDKKTGKRFYHFNTHFDHIGVAARAESAVLLLRKAAVIAGNSPVIVTGDFNCPDTDDPYKTLTDTASEFYFSDAMYLSAVPHHGPLTTFSHTFLCPGQDGGPRIDYLFVRQDIEVLRHAILSDNWNGRLASDHLPVLGEIKVMK